MVKVGERLQYKLMEKPVDGGKVVHVSQVAHVTFYITEHPWLQGQYNLFDWSEKRGMGQSVLYDFNSYEEVSDALTKEQVKLEEILERKRKGMPTQKQVYFLFSNGMPIPPDLTWGQASDLIDEKMVQLDKERQAYFQAKAEKYNGFVVGMRVSHSYRETRNGPLMRVEGEIVKLTSSNDGHMKYAWVKFDGYAKTRFELDALQKIAQEGA